jgi:hypothetical protein
VENMFGLKFELQLELKLEFEVDLESNTVIELFTFNSIVGFIYNSELLSKNNKDVIVN